MMITNGTTTSSQAGNKPEQNAPAEQLPLLITEYENAKSPAVKKSLANRLAILLWQIVVTGMEGGIDAGAFLSLSDNLLSGWQSSYQEGMQICAQFGVAPVAVLSAIRIILEQHVPVSDKLLTARRVWEGAGVNMRLSGFCLPLFFYLITDVVRAIKHESSSTPVYISNTWAGLVIATCVLIGSWGGVKSFYDDKRRRDVYWFPEEDNKLQQFLRFISTNAVARRVLAALDGGSAVHWLVYAFEKFLDLNSSQPAEIVRYASTAAAGLVSAILMGGAEPEKKFYFKPFEIIMRFIKAAGMGFTLYNAFGRPNASDFWGASTIRLQFYFWVAAFPLFVTLAQLGVRFIKYCFFPPDEHRIVLTPQSSNPQQASSLPFLNADGTLDVSAGEEYGSKLDEEEVVEVIPDDATGKPPSPGSLKNRKC